MESDVIPENIPTGSDVKRLEDKYSEFKLRPANVFTSRALIEFDESVML